MLIRISRGWSPRSLNLLWSPLKSGKISRDPNFWMEVKEATAFYSCRNMNKGATSPFRCIPFVLFHIFKKKNLKTGWKYYSSWYTQLTFQEFKKGLRIILILKQINRWFHKIHCLGLPSMLWFQRILEKRSQWKWSEGVHQDCEDPGGFQVLLQERESNTWSTFPNFCFPVNQPISPLFLFSITPKRFAQLL